MINKFSGKRLFAAAILIGFLSGDALADGNITSGQTVDLKSKSTVYGTVTADAGETTTVKNTGTSRATATIGGDTAVKTSTSKLIVGNNVDYLQSAGTFGAAAGTGNGAGILELGGTLTVNTAGGGINTLIAGSDSAIIAGSEAFVIGAGKTTANELNFNLTISNIGGVTFDSDGTAVGGGLDINGRMLVVRSKAGMGSGTNSALLKDTAGTGILKLDGATAADGVFTIRSKTNEVGTLLVDSGRYGTLAGSDSENLLKVKNLAVNGELLGSAGVELETQGAVDVSSGIMKVRLLDWRHSGFSFEIGKLEVVGASYLNNQIAFTSSTGKQTGIIDRLDITTAVATGLTIDNTGDYDSELAIGTANIEMVQAGTDVVNTLRIHKTSGTGKNKVNIGTLNLMGQSSGAADTSKVKLLITSGPIVTVTTTNVGDGFGGAIDAYANTNMPINMQTVNVGSEGKAESKFKAMGVGHKAISIGTLNLNGTTGGLAIFDSQSGHNTIDTINIAMGKAGKIQVHLDNNHSLTVKTINAEGELTFDENNPRMAATGSVINVGSSGALTLVAGKSLDFSTDTRFKIDLGSGTGINGVESDTSKFATVSGQLKTAAPSNTGDTVSQVYADNGVSRIIYNNVFSTAIKASDGSDFTTQKLGTMDRLRIYKLADGGKDIAVATNVPGIYSLITSNRGSVQTAAGLVKIVDQQKDMNAVDAAYVAELTKLDEAALTRATQQTVGQEATTGTAQSAIQGVQGAAGAVATQLTSFRSGSIAAGMTSFGSGGATAALSDMADADTLAEAYEEGFSEDSNYGVYQKLQVWAKGYVGFGEQGTVDEMLGYDFWNIGTMVGLDYACARELRVGALFGYSYNDTTQYEGAGDSQDNVLRLGAYSSYNWDNFFIDLSPTMGIHMIESRRNIWNGTQAKGERTGIDFNMSGTVGYDFVLPGEFRITPSYSLSYTMFYDPEFSESGAGAANVDYDSFTSNSLIQDLEVKVGKLFRTSSKLAFLPEVWGGWEVEYLNTGGTRNTVNVGQNFDTNMNGMATHRGYWGMGITALIRDNISVYGRYDQKIWDTGYNVGFTAGVKICF